MEGKGNKQVGGATSTGFPDGGGLGKRSRNKEFSGGTSPAAVLAMAGPDFSLVQRRRAIDGKLMEVQEEIGCERVVEGRAPRASFARLAGETACPTAWKARRQARGHRVNVTPFNGLADRVAYGYNTHTARRTHETPDIQGRYAGSAAGPTA